MPDERPLTTIDLHTHILPGSWPDLTERYGYGGWPGLEHSGGGCARMVVDGRDFRAIDSRSWDVARRLEDCDRDGVELQVLSTVPIMFSYWARPDDALDLSRRLNDHIAGVVAGRPDRFIGLGTLPMQSPDLAIGELTRCVQELGMPGVEIGTHVQEWNLDDPEVYAVLEAAADLGAGVFVHPWDMLGGERMSRYMMKWLVGMPAEEALALCSLIFGGVLERLPGLRVAVAHGGGSFAGTLGRIEHGFHARPDLCAAVNDVNPRQYLGRFWVDSLVHDPETLRCVISLFGPRRVALGSDYPFPLGEDVPGALVRSMTDLDDATRAALLGGAAREFLALPEPGA